MEILKASFNASSLFVTIKENDKEERIKIDRKNPIGDRQSNLLKMFEEKIEAEMDTWKGKEFFYGDLYDTPILLG